MADLATAAAELPTGPGCYLFRDRKGRVLYVGKAANLRARVRQYLAGADERAMVPFLVRAAASVDAIRTHTEKEALLLENSLIKRHRPRYNVKLRDDSNFLHLRLDLRERWPRYRLVRRILDDGARYFGPYHSASKARSTLAFLQRAFPLRTCTDAVLRSRRRPCLLHQMGRCVAPCVDGMVTEEAYLELARASTGLLTGRTRRSLANLRQRMTRAADAERFEEAARLRDLIASIEASVERQRVVDPRRGDRDVWGLYREGSRGAVAVLPVREGVMGEPRVTLLSAAVGDDGIVLSSLVNAAYAEGSSIPAEVVLPALPPDHAALAEVLSERRGRRCALVVPQRGDKVRLVALAAENARVRWLAETDADERHRHAMRELARALELPEPPRRMECFDNSHIAGANPVAAMAVFVDGRPDRHRYRKYRIKEARGGDDYASMREILERRFRRALDEDDLPDLLVVDGGRGQVGVATAVLGDLGIHGLPVVGIAKPRTERRQGQRHATDKLVLPHRKDPITLRRDHPGLRILQHLRDEAHRSAVRYQRQVRRKHNLASALEGIPGVGAARRKALLRDLGSAEAVARAAPDRLAQVPGIGPAMARRIWEALHPDAPPDALH